MKGKDIRIGLFFGGSSTEHEVSIRSAQTIAQALEDNATLVPIYVTKGGAWLYDPSFKHALLNKSLIKKTSQSYIVTPLLGSPGTLITPKGVKKKIDVAFPIIHGTTGEDGAIQGMFQMWGVPFVGPDTASSALCFDKDYTKQLLKEKDIPTLPYLVHTQHTPLSFARARKELGKKLCIKPARQGSSIGVNIVETQKEYAKALEEALVYDTKIIIEPYRQVREIECAILGNEHPETSVLGEIVSQNTFYSYDTKYSDDSKAELHIPAHLTRKEEKEIETYAHKAYEALGCRGLARVDFFLTDSGDIFLNEINTLPGFTSVSMYPLLWKATGVSLKELVKKLITYAQKETEHSNF